jgi:hypothetical protein
VKRIGLLLAVAAAVALAHAAPNAAAASTVRVNSGGGAYTAGDGRTFLADQYFTGGATYSTASAIAGTSDPALYQNERWGAFSYAIPVANGTYDVKLHFVEIYYGTAVAGSCLGKRVFSIDLGDTPTSPDIANLDICAAAGGPNTALVKTIANVTVSDGTLNVQAVYGSADDPELAAIEVVPAAATGPPTVTAQTPPSGATDVSTGTTVTATFSRAMDATTITSSSFTLTGPSGSVAASVSYNAGTNTATLTPSAALASSTTYTAKLDTTIKASDGTPLASAVTWSFTTITASGASTVRINAGGPAYTAADGRVFSADQYFTGGSTFSSGAAIAQTSDPALYQNERWGGWSYAIPIANGVYDVKLHFVELYFTPPCSGKRVFSVDIVDTAASPDIANLDICAAVDARTALVKTIQGVAVTDGVLNIKSVYGSADDPEIAAIEVVPAGPPASQVGQWSSPQVWPLVAVHASLSPTGNVLLWEDWSESPGSERVWNPNTGAFVPVPLTVDNRFCAGHINLADGRTLVVGGYNGVTAGVGTNRAAIFDPSNGTWSQAAHMAEVRWYPTATMLPDGRVLVFSGDNLVFDPSRPTPLIQGWDSIPEVFDPVKNTWTQLTGARLLTPYYPFMFVLPDGRIFDAGADTTTRTLSPITWTWQTVGTSPIDGHSAVMYRPGKVMKSGTWADPSFKGIPADGRTAVIDMNQANPAWRETAPMAYPRSYHNLTILPDGTVLATGGETQSDGENPLYAVYPAELWNPDTERWTTLSSMTIPRLYHSIGLLLPDGRVLVAGGGGTGTAPDENNAEIYSPPYLFKGSRPTITSAPSIVQYGSTFQVSTPDAANVSSVSLVRLGSVTHAFNEDQRFTFLNFTRGSGVLDVSAPANSNLAPPGYYMLFILSSSGVPSIASFVRFPAPSEDAQPPTAPGNLTATGGLGQASLSWQASTDNVGVTKYDVYRSTTSGFTPSTANRIAQPTGTSYTDSGLAAGTYYYLVKAEDAAGNLSPASNEANATVTSDTTPPSVAITAPAAGPVTGTITVSADASDNVGVAGVQFKVDGQNIGAEDTTSPYSVSWTSSSVANGPHDLTAVARDASSNSATSQPVTVTVSNTGPTGLVAAYNFDAGSGTTVADLSGKGNTGTLSNATWTTAGHTNGALSFNGTNALVSVPDSASLDLTTGMTLEAWVNPSALGTAWRTVVMKEQPPGNLAYALYANTDTTRPSAHVFTSAEAILRGTSALLLNGWTHLAASYDGTTLRLYVNGTQVASVAASGAITTTAGSLRIGGNNIWSEWFAGVIDDVRVYNRALTATEIQTDMNTPVR